MTALDAIHARINSFTEEKDGWNGPDSFAVPKTLIEIVHKLCDRLAESNQLPVDIGMLEEGGIDIHWYYCDVMCWITHENGAPYFDISQGVGKELKEQISDIEVFAEKIKNYLNEHSQ